MRSSPLFLLLSVLLLSSLIISISAADNNNQINNNNNNNQINDNNVNNNNNVDSSSSSPIGWRALVSKSHFGGNDQTLESMKIMADIVKSRLAKILSSSSSSSQTNNNIKEGGGNADAKKDSPSSSSTPSPLSPDDLAGKYDLRVDPDSNIQLIVSILVKKGANSNEVSDVTARILSGLRGMREIENVESAERLVAVRHPTTNKIEKFISVSVKKSNFVDKKSAGFVEPRHLKNKRERGVRERKNRHEQEVAVEKQHEKRKHRRSKENNNGDHHHKKKKGGGTGRSHHPHLRSRKN